MYKIVFLLLYIDLSGQICGFSYTTSKACVVCYSVTKYGLDIIIYLILPPKIYHIFYSLINISSQIYFLSQ